MMTLYSEGVGAVRRTGVARQTEGRRSVREVRSLMHRPNSNPLAEAIGHLVRAFLLSPRFFLHKKTIHVLHHIDGLRLHHPEGLEHHGL
jgi:hypothetical protein